MSAPSTLTPGTGNNFWRNCVLSKLRFGKTAFTALDIFERFGCILLHFQSLAGRPGTQQITMKRHKSLYPLSHDHHHALVQAKNLRLAASGSDRASLHQIAIQVIAFWESELQIHFRQEEEILLPVFSQYTASDRPEMTETLKQHADIQHAVDRLSACIEQEIALTAESRILSELLSQHIRYEEQILFPAVQEAVPEEALWEINRLLTMK